MINVLLPDQVRALDTLGSLLTLLPDADSAYQVVTARMAEILGVGVALVTRRRAEWQVLGDVRNVSANLVSLAIDHLPPLTTAPPEPIVKAVVVEKVAWTCVSVGAGDQPPLWLLLQADLTLSARVLQTCSAQLSRAFSAVNGRTRARLRRAREAFVLPRRLARLRGVGEMYQMTMDACARAVGATKGSLTIYNDDQRSLAVAATFGYPDILVRHLTFRPGTGIIGTVFRTQQARRVEDIRRVTDGPGARLRYRTPSYMAVPLAGCDRPLGVLCVSDRQDGRPFSVEDLTTLRALAGVASLALERARALELASAREHDAAIDPLTGLFNRRYFHARLDEEIERARRQSIPLTLAMVDIDEFKEYNDRLGHQAGDTLLRAVADALRRSVRVFDVCARIGGDEFTILMPGGTDESRYRIAARVREEIQRYKPHAMDLPVSVSIGIHSGTPATAAELLTLADEALYVAKRAGKARDDRRASRNSLDR